jgi:hypothetical protein
MNGSFGDNVGVEAVAEIDGIDVITVPKSSVSSLSLSLSEHRLQQNMSWTIWAPTAATTLVAPLRVQQEYVLTIPSRCT